jgi:hypothetical protein
MWKMRLGLALGIVCVGCTYVDEPTPCDPPPSKAYALPELSCDAHRPTESLPVDGVVVNGSCVPRCNQDNACEAGERWRTFVTVDDDTCAVGHVCYCEHPAPAVPT